MVYLVGPPGEKTVKTVIQDNHGFTLPAHKFIPVYRANSGNYVAATVTQQENLVAKGFIVGIPDANTLEILDQQAILEVGPHGLAQGINYYLGLAAGAILPRKTAPIHQKIVRVIDENTIEFLREGVKTGEISPAPGNTILLNPVAGDDLNDGFNNAVKTLERVEELLEVYDFGENTATISISGAAPLGDLDCNNVKAERIRILGSGTVILSDQLIVRNFNGFSFIVQNLTFSGNARLVLSNCSNITINTISVTGITRTGGIISAAWCASLTINGVTVDGASGVNLSNFLDLIEVFVSAIDISLTSALTCTRFIEFKEGCLYADLSNGGTNGFLTGRGISVFNNGLMQIVGVANYIGSSGDIISDTNIVDGSDFDNLGTILTSTTKSTAIAELANLVSAIYGTDTVLDPSSEITQILGYNSAGELAKADFTLPIDRQRTQQPANNPDIFVLANGATTPTPWITIDGMSLTTANIFTASYEITTSFKSRVNTNSEIIEFSLFINNVMSSEYFFSKRYDQADDDVSITTLYEIVNVAPNSLLEFRCRNIGTATTLTINQRYMKAIQTG